MRALTLRDAVPRRPPVIRPKPASEQARRPLRLLQRFCSRRSLTVLARGSALLVGSDGVGHSTTQRHDAKLWLVVLTTQQLGDDEALVFPYVSVYTSLVHADPRSLCFVPRHRVARANYGLRDQGGARSSLSLGS